MFNIRPCSIVLVIAPSGRGKTALVKAMTEDSIKGANQILVTNQEQDAGVHEVAGRLVIIDDYPLRSLRNPLLRQVVQKEGLLGVDLFATAQSMGQLSQLDLWNADYLVVKDLPTREIRRLSKLTRYSVRRLHRAMQDGWLIIDRRDNSLHSYIPTTNTDSLPAAETAPQPTAEPAPQAQGWIEYLASFIY